MRGFIYLASPYSDPDPKVRTRRFLAARAYVHRCFLQKQAVFSPIVHWHQLALECHLPYEFEFWQAQNDVMVASCERFQILCADGWETSRGIQHEKQMALTLDKPTTYILIDPFFDIKTYKEVAKP